MGRRFTFLMAAGLAVACAFGIGGQMAIADEATIENVAASDWMSVLEDERYISDIAIPGTHSSASKDFYDATTGDPVDVENCAGGFGDRGSAPSIINGIYQGHRENVSIFAGDIESLCRRQDLGIYDQLNNGVRLIEIDTTSEMIKVDDVAQQPTLSNAIDRAICYNPCNPSNPDWCCSYRYYYSKSGNGFNTYANVFVMQAWQHVLMPWVEPTEEAPNGWIYDWADVDRFLQEHPTETVLLIFKYARNAGLGENYNDCKFGDEPTTYACIDRILDALEETGRLYRGSEIPQLEDVRGKIVLLNTSGIDWDANHNNPNHKRYEFYKDFYGKPWIDGGIDVTMGAGERETDGVTFTRLQDQRVGTARAKVNNVTNTTFANANEAEFPTLGQKGTRSALSYTSGVIRNNGPTGPDAVSVSNAVNPAIEDFVANELQPNHNIGWLLSDFVGTSLQPSTIFRTNTPLLTSETDPDPDPDPNPDPSPDPDPDPDPDPEPAPAPAPAPTYQGHEMHRLYNPNSGEHFYTASTGERDAAVAAGWIYEGIGWTAPVPTQGIATKPVYRLYNQFAGDHHYTQSLEERNALIGFGWTYEGVGWYSGGLTALWRQYNPNAVTGTHNYTPSSEERFALVALGWKDEGVAWYGL